MSDQDCTPKDFRPMAFSLAGETNYTLVGRIKNRVVATVSTCMKTATDMMRMRSLLVNIKILLNIFFRPRKKT